MKPETKTCKSCRFGQGKIACSNPNLGLGDVRLVKDKDGKIIGKDCDGWVQLEPEWPWG